MFNLLGKNNSTLSVLEHWRKLPREVVQSSVEIIQTRLDCSVSLAQVILPWQGVGLRDLQRSLPTPAIAQFSNPNLSSTESIVSWTKSFKLLLKMKWQFSYHLNVFENFNHDSFFISRILQMPSTLNKLP